MLWMEKDWILLNFDALFDHWSIAGRKESAVLSKKGETCQSVGCRIESNCPLVWPGAIGGMPSVGVFLRDPGPIYASFNLPIGRKVTSLIIMNIKLFNELFAIYIFINEVNKSKYVWFFKYICIHIYIFRYCDSSRLL